MKKLLILSLALATLAGCASADYGHTASSTGAAFKMVKPKPGGSKIRDVRHFHSASLAASSVQQA